MPEKRITFDQVLRAELHRQGVGGGEAIRAVARIREAVRRATAGQVPAQVASWIRGPVKRATPAPSATEKGLNATAGG